MTRNWTGLSITAIALAFVFVMAVSAANACPGYEQGTQTNQGKGYLFAMGAKGSSDKEAMPNSSKSGERSDMDRGSFDQGNRGTANQNQQNYDRGSYDQGWQGGTMNRGSDFDRGTYDKDRGSYDKDRGSFDRDKGTAGQGMSNQGSVGDRDRGNMSHGSGSSAGSTAGTGGTASSGGSR